MTIWVPIIAAASSSFGYFIGLTVGKAAGIRIGWRRACERLYGASPPAPGPDVEEYGG
jgi:hypothetical protein